MECEVPLSVIEVLSAEADEAPTTMFSSSKVPLSQFMTDTALI